MKLVTAATMRDIDRTAIDDRGIPSEKLMENAGRGIAHRILTDLIPDPDVAHAAIFCGKGNNGGDGFVVARHLHREGVEVVVYFMGPIDKLSPDARLNFDRAAGAGLTLVEIEDRSQLPADLEADLIVDAVFGTGFSGAPRGLAGEVIEYINLQDSLIVSVDMPSGLNADTGEFEGSVVQADFTYTLALPKFGLFVSPGRELSGDVEVVPIGIPDDVPGSFDIEVSLSTVDLVSELMPERKADGHKGDFGKVVIVAGSTGLTGAATMAGEACLRGGSGLVKVACPLTVQPVLATKLTEVMTYPLPDVARKGALALRGLGELRKLASEQDALVIGPGIGRHRETFELVRRLVSKLDRPAIIDADGLNAFEGHTEKLKDCKAPLVLTPHPGEFKRLSGESVPQGIHERVAVARSLAAEFGVVLVLKGSPTLVAGPNGDVYLNPTGNHGMASGGTGDVLSGLVGSFLGQGMEAVDAAVVAVYVHGLAGDFAAESLTPRALIAGDLIDFLPQVFELLE
ncbi:NAD(P)H-hydrate dehydratase [candidate division GN15 bacterium]|nr:NAD(P)H-hydrate dehydratase [candidate division GN15 bacterium]